MWWLFDSDFKCNASVVILVLLCSKLICLISIPSHTIITSLCFVLENALPFHDFSNSFFSFFTLWYQFLAFHTDWLKSFRQMITIVLSHSTGILCLWTLYDFFFLNVKWNECSCARMIGRPLQSLDTRMSSHNYPRAVTYILWTFYSRLKLQDLFLLKILDFLLAKFHVTRAT